jgi:Mg-chelatase subunit ChlD
MTQITKSSTLGKAFGRILFFFLTAAIMAALIPPSVMAQGETPMVELILDASGSMNGRLKGGEMKIEAAKRAVEELVKNLPPEMDLAFRAYGHQSPRDKKDCQDTEVLTGFAPVSQNREQVLSKARSLKAQGYTPITYVLTLAAEDFPKDSPGDKTIVLVSDGKETCQGDPCAAAQALAESGARLVVHTVGFGVDEVTKSQLECIARATGGKYFGASDAQELIAMLNAAVKTRRVEVVKVKKKGFGWIKVEGADLNGHVVTKAETGEEVETISSLKSTVKLPEGIYNVTVGQGVWKSVEVKSGETTVLEPGWLTVEKASIQGHTVIDSETGVEHGSVSNLKSTMALMPGSYEVSFGQTLWPVEIKAGQTTRLTPGTVQVKHADIQGHAIFDAQGREIGSVSATLDWMPLPPGDYAIELEGERKPFTLKQGEDLVFELTD